jgi:hypothetical protein
VQANYDSAIDLLAAFTNGDGTTDSCLGHLYTDRDYDGTLGLAYIGTLCGSSYNTGFHSVYGISTAVQQLTLTHEIGHSWGAEHDPEGTSCSPSEQEGGHYIMYASATDGSMINNKVFSECSVVGYPLYTGWLCGSKPTYR